MIAVSASEIPDSAFRLRWRRTWQDVENDFTAQPADGESCRIYIFRGGEAPFLGRWRWIANRDIYLGSGFADTAREAALEAERTFFA
jgi:hypothetical protein